MVCRGLPLPPPPSFPGSLGGGGGPPEFPGSGLPACEGVFGGAGAFSLASVPTGWVVVSLMAGVGPSPSVRKKWSIFRGLGRGVLPFLRVVG